MGKQMEKQVNRTNIQELLNGKLSGKRLVLGGSGKKRDNFVKHMTRLIEQNKADLRLYSGLEKAGAEDYAVLFYDKDFYTELVTLARLRVQSALLVSDHAVYGTCFGETEARSEEELGHVSHTSKDGIAVQHMRMAEHLVCRLAREEDVNIKVVRTDGELLSENPEDTAILVSMLRILTDGAKGEIYNLPASAEGDRKYTPGQNAGAKQEKTVFVWDEKRSPLSLMEIVPDTDKLKREGM